MAETPRTEDEDPSSTLPFDRMVSGLFVDHAETAEQAEDEARSEMVRAVSDDVAYWERISSAVLSCDVDQSAVDARVEPEFRDFAYHWAKTGRSLDVISNYGAYRQLVAERFERKQQEKAKRAARAERRLAAVAAAVTASGGGGRAPSYYGYSYGGSATHNTTPAELLEEEVDLATACFDVPSALTLLESVNEVFLAPLEGNVAEVLPELDRTQQAQLTLVFDDMMRCFRHRHFKKKYGYSVRDHTAPALVAGADVPAYFANVVSDSIYRRKLLSMAGLRNLIRYGPRIYEQLKAHQFSGDPAHYHGDVGLNLMRRVTGNVVDLDTTVLRCTCKATLNAINLSNAKKGDPTYATAEAFAKSTQAQEIAVHCSLPLLDDFAKLVGLTTEAQRKARQISATQVTTPVPVASGNSDRGHHPVWQYVNAGQNSFHANVPNLDDVNGALLKAPYHCAQLWAALRAVHGGVANGDQPDALLDRMSEFFEDCIVDSCFNQKWKAIEEFAAKVEHEGTIVDVLQRVQVEFQSRFTPELFESDDAAHSQEVALMWSLVEGRMGKSTMQGKALRNITKADVEAWVNDPSVEL